MELSYIRWTFGVFMFFHVTFYTVHCQAPINVRATYNSQTGNVTVTWKDPPGSKPASTYRVEYSAKNVSLRHKDVKEKLCEFTPPVMGKIYMITVYAYREKGRLPSDKANASVIAATPVYSTEGTVASVSLEGANGTTWEIRHDSNTALVFFDNDVQTNNLENTTVQVSENPLKVTITFSSVVRENAGIYISKRRSGTQMLSSFVLVLTAEPSTPVISRQSVAVIERSVTLKCSSKSNSVPVGHGLTLSYSWRINDTDIQSGVKYFVNNDVLTIQKLEITDRYNRYGCTATEERGLASDTSYHILDLVYGPQWITLEPPRRNVTVEEGATISPITCTADCHPSCALQWKKKSQLNNTNVGSGAVLNLGSADRQEDGAYICVAVGDGKVPNNLRTRQSPYVYIDVKYPASISRVQYSVNSTTIKTLQERQTIQVRETDQLVITCTADADPEAEVELLDKENKTLAEGLNTAKLTSQVKCEDTGKYVFQASNRFNNGVPARRDFNMTVNCQPREMYNTPKIFGGKPDEKVVFMTTVIAYPVPTATWDRSVTDNGVIPINDFTFNVSGYVDIQGEESYRNYNVTIGNTKGRNLVLKFVIRAQDRPNAPINFTAVGTSHDSANLTWISPFNGGSVQTFTIEQKQTQPQTPWREIATNIVDNGQNKGHFYFAMNLKPDTSYQFRLHSRNNIGPSEMMIITVATIAAPVTQGQSGQTNPGLIVGLVTGNLVIIAVVLGIVGILCFLKKRKRTEGNTEEVLYAVPQKSMSDRSRNAKEVAYGNSGAPTNEVLKTSEQESPSPQPKPVKQRKVNQDGLIYIDVEIKQQPESDNKKPVIHGDEDRTNYTSIDFTKKADPLPDDEIESEYANHQ